MEDILVPIFVNLIIFSAAFGIVYVVITARNKERMALIEKGADPAIFKTESKPYYIILKLALLLIGIGSGILLASYLHHAMRMEDEIGIPSMILLCGGIGLLLSYFIQYKIEKRKKI